MRRVRVDLPVLALVGGLLLAQIAWIAAVPPYRGLDEWDHAYRAAAVADGQWVATPEAATRLTGAVLRVPDHIVEAARPECERLPYTGDRECVGLRRVEGYRDVASGAGRYHPAFYALVGHPSLPFSGVSALYAMRAAGALACLAMMVLAVVCMRRWAGHSSAPFLALAVAITPSVFYATAIAAPNGLEIAAGLGWWSALIGLAVAPHARHDRLFLVAAAVAGSILVTVRSLGPLWCALALVTCLVALPVTWSRVRQIVISRVGLVSITAVVGAALASAIWTVSQSTLQVGIQPEEADITWGERFSRTGSRLIVWPLQSIGAFPYRDQPAPALVYAVYLVLGITALVLGFRRFDRRGKAALGLGVATMFVLPSVVTLATIDEFGTAWQGRYELPYGIGLLLLAGVALQRAEVRIHTRMVVTGLVLFAIGQVMGPVRVLREEVALSPYSGTSLWSPPPVAVEGALVAVAACLIWWGAWAMGRGSTEPAHEEVPDAA